MFAMETYSILLATETAVPISLADPIATLLELRTGEVTKAFRDQPWIPLSGVPAIALDTIFDLLNREGIPARAVPTVHMPELADPLGVRLAEPLEDNFFLQAADPPAPPVLPWRELEAVTAGLVTVRAGENRRLYARTSAESPAAVEDEVFLLDLMAGDLRLRIDGKKFQYEYLRERKVHASRENMRLLLEDIRRRAPHARFGARVEGFMAGQPPSAFRFRSLASFDNYEQWMLHLVREDAEEEEGAGVEAGA